MAPEIPKQLRTREKKKQTSSRAVQDLETVSGRVSREGEHRSLLKPGCFRCPPSPSPNPPLSLSLSLTSDTHAHLGGQNSHASGWAGTPEAVALFLALDRAVTA